MIVNPCTVCGEALGPYEDQTCVSCRKRHPGGTADQAISVLERAPGPLYLHDIARGIARDYRWTVSKESLAVYVSQDWRSCWAGKGLYGLVRHGLLPGACGLATPAIAVVAAHGRPMATGEVGFVLNWMGYRFAQQSLVNALSRDPDTRWVAGGIWAPLTAARLRLYQAGLARTHREVLEALSTLAPRVAEGLDEYQRRLSPAGARNGTATSAHGACVEERRVSTPIRLS